MSARIPCAFRVWADAEGGGVIALFPTLAERSGLIRSFMHIGQHAAARPVLLTQLRKATREEARELRRELESAPYKYRLKYADTPD